MDISESVRAYGLGDDEVDVALRKLLDELQTRIASMYPMRSQKISILRLCNLPFKDQVNIVPEKLIEDWTNYWFNRGQKR
ncbi:19164_t:CDS:2 [Rhizophagus irregularis]|nr:19164_t:CDS:2 [Rhizophagus irregularis]